MNDRLTDVIARETDGKSCKAQKYSLDYDSQEYPQEESPRIWRKSAESSPRKKYIDLRTISRNLLHSGSQRLTYFLDGSRRVFKVDEIAYEHKKGKRIIYPVAAGQIGAGCCRRENRKLIPEKFIHETVIALPEIADSDGVPGFFPSIALKLNENPMIKRMGIKISSVLSYKTDRTSGSLEDKATAAIQTRMLECEKELTEQIARHLGHMNYLVKDGSLEYRKKSQTALQNYRWVLGVSKSFNPYACLQEGKEDPGYIAELPAYHRTQAACFSSDFVGDIDFAVWYIRLHKRTRTRSAFDGVVKVEKMLVTQSEREQRAMDSEEIDILSAYILNERCPVCYGNDSRWASHIYPVYLTEKYIKSKYISTESFLHLF